MGDSAAVATGTLGRYAIYEEIGAGGMATVHIGRLTGPANFARTVAIKRLHAHLARQPEFVTMFLDEARVAARVRHPNVVTTLDVVATSALPYLVMEYVQGESLACLQAAARERRERIPPRIACAIAVGLLHGLQAAHEATGERGELLGIVHRDVSPQNVLIGADGVARVLDFGVAKAAGRLQTTRESRLKGKLAYTAPELVRGTPISRAADIYSAGVVLWEMLAGQRLFAGDNEANVLERVLFADVAAPSHGARDIPPLLDAIALQALARDPAHRFTTARAMARAIEAAIPLASAAEVGEWVEALARDSLLDRAGKVARVESGAAVPIDEGRSRPSGRRPRAARQGALVVCAIIGAGTLAWLARRGLPASRATTWSSESVSHAGAPDSGEPPPSALPPPGMANVASSIEANPAPAAPPTVPVARRLAPAASLSTALPRPRPLLPTKNDCEPPWIVDADGVKKYKVECL